jgi:hypothetical protein
MHRGVHCTNAGALPETTTLERLFYFQCTSVPNQCNIPLRALYALCPTFLYFTIYIYYRYTNRLQGTESVALRQCTGDALLLH